jgi:hypothetical protein
MAALRRRLATWPARRLHFAFGLRVRMRVTVSKLVALAIAVAEIIAGLALERSWAFALTVAVGAILPLALIWFPEFFGSLTGWGTRAPVDRPSPPSLVALLGWLFLLGLPPLVFLVGGGAGR